MIEAERGRLFAETERLTRSGGLSARSAGTARVLLTRWWAEANWHKREALVRAADWLVRLEQNRQPPTPVLRPGDGGG